MELMFRYLSKKILFFTVLLCIPLTALSQEEKGEEEENKNDIVVFMGGTSSHESTAFTLGIGYQYKITRLIGVGGFLDHAFGDINSTIVAPALYLSVKNFTFLVGPGIEISDDDVIGVLRLGVEYQLEFSGFLLKPGLFFDTERDEDPSVVYGLSFGYGS